MVQEGSPGVMLSLTVLSLIQMGSFQRRKQLFVALFPGFFICCHEKRLSAQYLMDHWRGWMYQDLVQDSF